MTMADSPKLITVAQRCLIRVFLNLGIHPSIPPVPGLKESGQLTHIEALELDRLPEHLIVIGGG
jgi:pyruvate/2-oxoglutarate dehydrogenase complex dihydrolipoamide dehydrogenase (E3) component